MKKLLMGLFMILAISGVAMSQTQPSQSTPAHKKSHKEAHMKKSDSTASASGTQKTSKKKSHSTKHN